MNAIVIISIAAAAVILAIVIAWILTSNKAKAAFRDELGRKETEIRSLTSQVNERDADIIRKEAEVRTAEALRNNERLQHEQALKEIKASHEKALSDLQIVFVNYG